ncbi:hypothetical protein [Deinococcus humi]|uniref:Uncharacterized protein n=1 Tax=Deinococcus humi TaxID=662880 RepID=A0A7W8JZG4_9DEIO|nr:hypothetical protein [Deinococcus humi]MBB5366082.1 hypothetical protein [Deinococcus humi]GGO40071.1 hypothetical protein GCM10008949_49080 [Deinococcus humi]
MNPVTLFDAALDHLATLRQDAHHAHLVQQARGHHSRLAWRRLFRVPSVPAPVAPCTTC